MHSSGTKPIIGLQPDPRACASWVWLRQTMWRCLLCSRSVVLRSCVLRVCWTVPLSTFLEVSPTSCSTWLWRRGTSWPSRNWWRSGLTEIYLWTLSLRVGCADVVSTAVLAVWSLTSTWECSAATPATVVWRQCPVCWRECSTISTTTTEWRGLNMWASAV